MGVYQIDPAELNRVYPLNVDGNRDRTPRTPEETPDKGLVVRELQARLEAAQERLADKEALIADLREDRDRWRQQATALLADQRSAPAPDQPPAQPRRLLEAAVRLRLRPRSARLRQGGPVPRR